MARDDRLAVKFEQLQELIRDPWVQIVFHIVQDFEILVLSDRVIFNSRVL